MYPKVLDLTKMSGKTLTLTQPPQQKMQSPEYNVCNFKLWLAKTHKQHIKIVFFKVTSLVDN